MPIFDEDLPLAAALSTPLQLELLDHYTLIVEDAASVARFHEEVLAFTPLRLQKVNAGSVSGGEYGLLTDRNCKRGFGVMTG